MGRRSGFVGVINSIARDVARAQRQAEAARNRAIREAGRQQRELERMHRQTLRDRMAADREAKRQYVEDQLENAADQSAALEERVAHLERILVDGLAKGDRIDFDSLRVSDSYPPFDPPLDLLRGRLAPDREAYRAAVLPLGPIARLFAFNRRRHEALLLEADASFERDAADHSRLESDRLARLESARKAYEAARFESVWAATQRNSEVAEFSNAYSEGKPFAIVSCTEMVLTRSVYPDDFPQEFRLAYVAESRELVVDYQLPTLVVVPAVSEVRYVKTKDHFEEKPRKPRSRSCTRTSLPLLRCVHSTKSSPPIRVDTLMSSRSAAS